MAVNEERETIVNFMESEDTMQIYTCNRKWKNKLKAMGFEPDETDKIGGELYEEVPRNFLQLRKPRTLSEEDKEAARERLAAARKAAGIGEFRPKAKKAKKGKKAPKVEEPEEDEDDEEEEDVDDEDEDDDEDEEVEVVRRKRPAKKAAPAAKKPVKKTRK